MLAPTFLFLLSTLLTASLVQAATVTFKDVIDPGASNLSEPSYSVFLSFSEAGIKSGSDGSAETTYVEELHQSQAVEMDGTALQIVPLNTTVTVVGTRVESSNGHWESFDVPLTFSTTTVTAVSFETCSLLAGGEYGCVDKLAAVGSDPVFEQATTTSFTNSATDFVQTDVGELRNVNNGVASGFTSTITWQIISVAGAMLTGVWVVL
ncbi:hypothetical protein PM082_015274 [Marasmius tenuissimus]|nr:hypothetical protein PM082_015274 [Marasmius tenuissimus]